MTMHTKTVMPFKELRSGVTVTHRWLIKKTVKKPCFFNVFIFCTAP